MKFGYYNDKELPKSLAHKKLIKEGQPTINYNINSHGYRCPEFSPLPDGKKNVVILGCSHTFGVGLDGNEHWVHFLSQHNTDRLRYWNLAVPGCSGDRMVRILYGAEKVLFPNIIICCWPNISRRERLDKIPIDLFGRDKYNRFETDDTDKQNFLKNVFFVQKFAENNQAKVFHCFAEDVQEMPEEVTNVLDDATLKRCWPPWDDHNLPEARKQKITDPNFAQDGIHYGEKHHSAFAELFLSRFGQKLR